MKLANNTLTDFIFNHFHCTNLYLKPYTSYEQEIQTYCIMLQNPDVLIICTSCHLKREGGAEVFKGSYCTEYNAYLMNSKAFHHYSLNMYYHVVNTQISSLTLPAFTYFVNCFCFLLNYSCARNCCLLSRNTNQHHGQGMSRYQYML